MCVEVCVCVGSSFQVLGGAGPCQTPAGQGSLSPGFCVAHEWKRPLRDSHRAEGAFIFQGPVTLEKGSCEGGWQEVTTLCVLGENV